MQSLLQSPSVALITGGASGIGLAIAHLLSSKYALRLVLADINSTSLASAKESLTSTDVETVVTDVSKLEDYAKLKEKALQRFGRVDLVFLNAGAASRGSFGEPDIEGFERTLRTNVYGVMNGITTFLPVLKASSGPTAFVITGSKQGITNPPGSSPIYNASKSAIKTMAEHLSYEVRDTQIGVHLLVPGWTFTGMTGGGNVKEKPAGAWTAGQVAEYMLEKMKEDKFYIICPDNDTTEEMDQKRMQWSMGDVIENRKPLSRWRGGETGEMFEKHMKS